MGNSVGKVGHCFTRAGEVSQRYDIDIHIDEPMLSEEPIGLGHSFCYFRPELTKTTAVSGEHFSEDVVTAAATPSTTITGTSSAFSSSSSSSNSDASQTTMMSFFRSISGASVSANASTPPSTSLLDCSCPYSSAFESSDSFFSVPLQPVPRGHGRDAFSGPVERGFLSGPIERSFLSGPVDLITSSGPQDNEDKNKRLDHVTDPNIRRIPTRDMRRWRLFRGGELGMEDSFSVKKRVLLKRIKRAWSSKVWKSFKRNSHETTHEYAESESNKAGAEEEEGAGEESDLCLLGSQNLQWAQGKAGEDRMHIVISEEKGWVFVGIYDGFNGPDAPDYLLSNLYINIYRGLEGLLWRVRDEQPADMKSCSHKGVLNALAEALNKTEEGFFEDGDENPELALMGSCVLVMLMKGEDLYLMNVGDSRALLARTANADVCGTAKTRETIQAASFSSACLRPIQLTIDHSTYVEEEAERIRREHPDDASAIMNDRVKGYLKVTRAFGVGFLKQPKWNEQLLEMFRIHYIGTAPYIICNPSLYHYRLSSRDRFLILSSDGLYQYFTNEEVVGEVDNFLLSFPDGDPAQHLVEEVLFRAAKKAGLDFHELLDVPQGERRRYHDDVSVIIISLEGRIWRSSI